MRFLDLFAGIGGFALGAEWAGLRFDGHYYSEIDPYAIRVYQKRFPHAVGLGDITKITGLPKGDWIIAGGFPCQDISVAGLGAGLDGARSGLWYHYARLIGELRPRFAVMENVGALTFRGLDRVLGSLAEIGYDAEWQDIRASDVGAPHRRERIWIVAYPKQREGGERYQPSMLGRRADVPDADRTRRERQRIAGSDEAQEFRAGRDCATLADTEGTGSGGAESGDEARLAGPWSNGASIPNSDEQPTGRPTEPRRQRSQWATEPDVGRVAHGVPAFLDGGISDGQMATKEGRTEGDPEDGQVRKVWIDGESTEASSRLQQAKRSKNTLPRLPCDSGSGRRDEARKADAEMRGVREDVRSAGFSQTQDLRCCLSSDPRTRKRIEAVAWENEPDIVRVAIGVKNRVDRLKCLGNAIVPQIAEMIFREIRAQL